jgi:hypothetical protein
MSKIRANDADTTFLMDNIRYERPTVGGPETILGLLTRCIEDNWSYYNHGEANKLGFCFLYELLTGVITVPDKMNGRQLARFALNLVFLNAQAVEKPDDHLKNMLRLLSFVYDHPDAHWPRCPLGEGEMMMAKTSHQDVRRWFKSMMEVVKPFWQAEKKASPSLPTLPSAPRVTVLRSQQARTFNER